MKRKDKLLSTFFNYAKDNIKKEDDPSEYFRNLIKNVSTNILMWSNSSKEIDDLTFKIIKKNSESILLNESRIKMFEKDLAKYQAEKYKEE